MRSVRCFIDYRGAKATESAERNTLGSGQLATERGRARTPSTMNFIHTTAVFYESFDAVCTAPFPIQLYPTLSNPYPT